MPSVAEQILDEALIEGKLLPKPQPDGQPVIPTTEQVGGKPSAATPTPSTPAPIPTPVSKVERLATPVQTPPAAPSLDPNKVAEILKPKEIPLEINDATLEAFEKGLPEAQRSGFNAKVRVRMRELQHELADLKTKVTPVTADTQALQAELDKAKKEAQDLNSKIGQYALTETTEFKRTFTEPAQKIQKQLEDIFTGYEIDKEVLHKAMKAQGADLIKLLKDEASPAVAIIHPLINQLQTLEAQKEMALQNANQTIAKFRQDQQQSQLAQQAKAREQAFLAALETRKQSGDYLLKEIPGNDEWNKGVGTIYQMAKHFFESPDPALRSQALVMAAQFPVMADMFQKLIQQHEALKTEYKALTGMAPRLGGEQPSVSETVTEKPKVEQDAASAADEILNVISRPK